MQKRISHNMLRCQSKSLLYYCMVHKVRAYFLKGEAFSIQWKKFCYNKICKPYKEKVCSSKQLVHVNNNTAVQGEKKKNDFFFFFVRQNYTKQYVWQMQVKSLISLIDVFQSKYYLFKSFTSKNSHVTHFNYNQNEKVTSRTGMFKQ